MGERRDRSAAEEQALRATVCLACSVALLIAAVIGASWPMLLRVYLLGCLASVVLLGALDAAWNLPLL
jgi:hypothetical protein